MLVLVGSDPPRSVSLLGCKQPTAFDVPKGKGKSCASKLVQQVFNLWAWPSPVPHDNLMLDSQPTGSREWGTVLTSRESALTRPVNSS